MEAKRTVVGRLIRRSSAKEDNKEEETNLLMLGMRMRRGRENGGGFIARLPLVIAWDQGRRRGLQRAFLHTGGKNAVKFKERSTARARGSMHMCAVLLRQIFISCTC